MQQPNLQSKKTNLQASTLSLHERDDSDDMHDIQEEMINIISCNAGKTNGKNYTSVGDIVVETVKMILPSVIKTVQHAVIKACNARFEDIEK